MVEAHTLSAAMTELRMQSLNDSPDEEIVPEVASELNSLDRRKILLTVVIRVVDKFIDLSYGEDKSAASKGDSIDHVQEYACEVLSFGLLLMEFEDAIKEGDGLRILRCWRYFLLVFKAAKWTNCAIEAFNLLAQYTFSMSPQMAQQLIWSRTINTSGRPGRNIPCDAKNALAGLGSNITDESSKRIGRCLGKTVAIAAQFDAINSVKVTSGRHSSRSSQQDMEKLLKQLHEESKVFTCNPGRKHKTFPNIEHNMIRYTALEDLNIWMHKQLSRIVMYK